jgi:hypothetical protein
MRSAVIIVAALAALAVANPLEKRAVAYYAPSAGAYYARGNLPAYPCFGRWWL